MASYGLLLAFSGVTYDGTTRSFTGDPGRAYKGFYCTPHGWGTVSSEGGRVTFEPAA